MKEFKSLGAFTKQLDKIINQHLNAQHAALDFIGEDIEFKAKEKIGHLQQGDGEFPSWSPLSESTVIDKQRKGYDFNDEHNPLYRTGELEDSIHHVVDVLNYDFGRVYIGSPLDIALYQEMGTKHIPARSFLGLTMFKEKEYIQSILGTFLYSWISGIDAKFRIRK